MKKTITIHIITIAGVFFITYLLHNSKVRAAEKFLIEQEAKSRNSFLNIKDSYLKKFSQEYPNRESLFNQYFNAEKAKYSYDTTINYFIYSSSIQATKYDKSFFECLFLKCEFEIEKEAIDKEINTQLSFLRDIYGSPVDNWYKKIGRDKFISISNKKNTCESFFKETGAIQINTSAFHELKLFFSEMSDKLKAQSVETKASETQYEEIIKNARKNLTSSGRNLFEEQLENASLFNEKITSHAFESNTLGRLTYDASVKVLDERKLNSILDEVYIEQYKNNSLRTGSKPYAYCFGSNNSCSGYSCSEIRVKTPSNSDVLVTIKKNGSVYRHAYIGAGSSYTFNVPNGTYQTFFYYGRGWNPNKFMKNTSCGVLEGGFIAEEHFGKDNPQSMYSQVLTYELILQSNGNFSTKSSNKDEAL